MNGNHLNQNQAISIFDPDTLYNAKKKSRKKMIKAVVLLMMAVLLMCFVVWPKLIKPNLAEDNLYTPELINAYSLSRKISNGKWEYSSITITECSSDGKVKGYVEFIIKESYEDDIYGKYYIEGQIQEKKKNLDHTLKIEFIGWSVEPENSQDPAEAITMRVRKKCTVLQAADDDIQYSVGYDDFIPVSTVNDLKKMKNSGDVFILQNDIDMQGISWTPISGFHGTLIGSGHKISNLQISAKTDDVGFFSVLYGTVVNVEFENATVQVNGHNENIGILCGKLDNGSLNQIKVSGIVDAPASENVGGVVGYAEVNKLMSINNIENEANITGDMNVSGVFGNLHFYFSNGIKFYTLLLENIRNRGSVIADQDNCGGIIGYMEAEATGIGGTAYVRVSDCHNFGTIDGRYYVGGIIGNADGDPHGSQYSEIDACTNQSKIKGDAYVGCIAGRTYSFLIRNSSNENSSLEVTSRMIDDGDKIACVGGLVGYGVCIENCTNYINVDYTSDGAYVGGLMGYCNMGGSVYIRDLTNYGNVSGREYVGGIAGVVRDYVSNGINAYTCTLERLLNYGSVRGQGSHIGGHIGLCTGEADGIGGSMSFYVYDCVNEGDIQGISSVGGSIGCFDYQSAYRVSIKIEDCYTHGKVNMEEYGALVGNYANKRD